MVVARRDAGACRHLGCGCAVPALPDQSALWGEAVKLGLGIALLLGVLEGTKPLLSLLSGGAPWAHLVRYLLATLFAGIVWPLTFRFFEKQGKSRGDAAR